MLVISKVLVYGYSLKLSFNDKFYGYFQGQCLIINIKASVYFYALRIMYEDVFVD